MEYFRTVPGKTLLSFHSCSVSVPFGTPGCSSEAGVSFLYWSSGEGAFGSAASNGVARARQSRGVRSCFMGGCNGFESYFFFAGGTSFGGGRKNKFPFALVLRTNTLSAHVT